MKKILKGNEPERLKAYKEQSPNNTWAQFSREKKRKEPVDKQLKKDQGGLCAYCEIDLRDATITGKADFRVEHFHPKSDKTSGHNWGLDWQNLCACCHGGSQKNVVEAHQRYTAPQLSCDAAKANKNLDGLILNPLRDIPAFPPLFTCQRFTGEVSPHLKNCQDAHISEEIVQNTIHKLKLNSDRLNALRKAKLNHIHDKISKELATGQKIQDVLAKYAQITLRKDLDGKWPSFFSSIRSYLGSAAEEHLQHIGYDG